MAALLTTAIWVLSGSGVGKWRQQLTFAVQEGVWASRAVILTTPCRVSSIYLPGLETKLEKMEGICQRPHQQRRHQRRPRQPDSEARLPHWVLSGFSHCEPGATNLERQTEEKQSDHVVPDPPEKHTRKGVRGWPSQSVRGGTSADILAVRTYESFRVVTAGEL